MPERGHRMTEPTPPGYPRAADSAPGRKSNGVRSSDYSSPTSPDEDSVYESELVTSPDHGVVGVFQAPQPVRPRGSAGQAVDPMDIDSPFLDLFGGGPAPSQPLPVEPPAEEHDPDFDF